MRMKVFLKTCNYEVSCHVCNLKSGHQTALKISRHFFPQIFWCSLQIELWPWNWAVFINLFVPTLKRSGSGELWVSSHQHHPTVSDDSATTVGDVSRPSAALECGNTVCKESDGYYGVSFFGFLSPLLFLCSLHVLMKSSRLRLTLGLRARYRVTIFWPYLRAKAMHF